MLKGSGAVVEACTGSRISAEAAIVVMTVLFVLYGLAGGLRAAIITDFVQGVLALFFSFLLLPFVLHAVGGISGMRQSFAELAPGKNMLSLVTPGDIGVFYITMIALNALLSVTVQPHNMGTCAAGRTELDGAVGFMGGTFLKRICTVAWCLTGLAAFAYYRGSVEDPDQVYGLMASQFLSQLLPGLLGLFLAGLLATVMGSCDSFMISASGLVTENLYRPLFPGRSETHYLWVARSAGLAVVVTAIGYAFWLSGVIQGLEILWKINAVMAPAFWLGIFWRGATTAGAWVATLLTALTWWVTGLPAIAANLASWPVMRSLAVVVRNGDSWAVSTPWQMLAYLTAGFVGGIVVSLCTRKNDPEQLDRFYELMRTPVQEDEVIEQPCTLPRGVKPAPRRVLFPSSSLELPVPTWRAVSGFLVGWLLVVGIIVGVWLLVS